MRWTIAGLIVAGVIAALSAAVLIASIRSSTREEVRTDDAPPPTEVEILVASRPIPAMTVVDAEAVATRVVLSNEVDPTLRTTYTNVVGQVLVTPMVEGEAFTDAHFANEGSGVNLAAALPEGHRAMSAMLTDDSGIIDLLYPGCVVDVIASFRLPSGEGVASGEVISVTLLQGVQVLAIGPQSVVTGSPDKPKADPEGDRRSRRRVTLMVGQDEAEALQLAVAHGELSVAMRNPLDSERVEDRGVLLTDLSGDLAERLATAVPVEEVLAPGMLGDAPEEPAARPRQVWTTIVMRGRQPERIEFPIEIEPTAP